MAECAKGLRGRGVCRAPLLDLLAAFCRHRWGKSSGFLEFAAMKWLPGGLSGSWESTSGGDSGLRADRGSIREEGGSKTR